MKKITTILACIDFSEYSQMIIEYAVEMAALPDVQIVVCNIVNQRDIDAVEKIAKEFPERIDGKSFATNLKKERHKMLRQMIKEYFFDKKSSMRIIVDTGVPFEAILQIIGREKIDLVILANKGRGNVSRVLFGSTAEKIFRHSPVPVLSLRGKKNVRGG